MADRLMKWTGVKTSKKTFLLSMGSLSPEFRSCAVRSSYYRRLAYQLAIFSKASAIRKNIRHVDKALVTFQNTRADHK
jgi:hypothetical protein